MNTSFDAPSPCIIYGAGHLALAFIELIFLFLARLLGVDLMCVPRRHLSFED